MPENYLKRKKKKNTRFHYVPQLFETQNMLSNIVQQIKQYLYGRYFLCFFFRFFFSLFLRRQTFCRGSRHPFPHELTSEIKITFSHFLGYIGTALDIRTKSLLQNTDKHANIIAVGDILGSFQSFCLNKHVHRRSLCECDKRIICGLHFHIYIFTFPYLYTCTRTLTNTHTHTMD